MENTSSVLEALIQIEYIFGNNSIAHRNTLDVHNILIQNIQFGAIFNQ